MTLTRKPVALSATGNEITDAVRAARLQGDGRAAPDSSFGIWPAATNLALNGGFELDISNWSNSGFLTWQRVTDVVKFGQTALRVTATGSGGQVYLYPNGATVSGATAGLPFTWAVWLYGEGAMIGKRMNVLLREQGGAQAYSETYTYFTVQAGWQHVVVTRTLVQNDRTNVQPFVYGLVDTGTQMTPGDTFVIDGCQHEPGPIATPYIETNGAAVARAAAQVRAPAITPLMNGAQGWAAARVRLGYPTNAPALPSGNPRVFTLDWGDAEARVVHSALPTGAGGQVLRTVRAAGGTTVVCDQPLPVLPAGSTITVVARWEAGKIGNSFNGAPFYDLADSTIPSGAPTDLGLGGRVATANQQLAGDMLWFGCGTGKLTDADAAALHALGNADPPGGVTQLPGAPTMLWGADDANAQRLVLLWPDRDEFEIARLPFAEAQSQLAGAAQGLPRSAACGWHGSLMSNEAGSFAIARSGGPFAELVGRRVVITHQLGRGRSVYAFVHAEAGIIEDISVTRSLFARLELLAADDLPALVQEVL